MKELLSSFLNFSFIKDFIYKHQFKKTLRKRMGFINQDKFEGMNYDDLIEKRDDLINFLRNFPNSEYYVNKVKKLISSQPWISFVDESDEERKRTSRERAEDLKEEIRNNKEEILKTVEEFIQLAK